MIFVYKAENYLCLTINMVIAEGLSTTIYSANEVYVVQCTFYSLGLLEHLGIVNIDFSNFIFDKKFHIILCFV